jgi:hypothetical protein
MQIHLVWNRYRIKIFLLQGILSCICSKFQESYMPPAIRFRVNTFFLLRTPRGVHSDCVISIQLYLLTLVSISCSDLCKFCLVHSWYLYNWVVGRVGRGDLHCLYIYVYICVYIYILYIVFPALFPLVSIFINCYL